MNRRVVIWLGILVALLPLIATLGTYLFASVFGCRIDEGSVHSCIVLGIDFGNMLYTLGLSFLLIFITLPVGGGIVIIGALMRNKSSVEVSSAPTPGRSAKSYLYTGILLALGLPILSVIGISLGRLSIPLISNVAEIIGVFSDIFSLASVPIGVVLIIIGIVKYVRNKS